MNVSMFLPALLAAAVVAVPSSAQQTDKEKKPRVTTGGVPAKNWGRRADDIPPGHRPPAGMCRIWIDGVPPGRQPAPTDCATAVRNRPANGRVIYGDDYVRPGKSGEREGRVDHDEHERDDGRVRTGRDDADEKAGKAKKAKKPKKPDTDRKPDDR